MGTGSWSDTRRSFPTPTRQAILRRDGHRCIRCGTDQHLIADHIIPVAEGGTHHPDNGQTLCTTCHDLKTQAEIARGRARTPTRRRPHDRRHPGLIAE